MCGSTNVVGGAAAATPAFNKAGGQNRKIYLHYLIFTAGISFKR